ncbi:hypothetical protein GCM10025869_19580 [Homoserinibacter gongjuensis]|uniref:Uncharacterized protein n=1 Tax=Homoserinibacter gongjuensis TaxID=1162968 RepID=A0ABQ6JWE9_9MICO|nr:hypothetical protein GCM10025869_19580 [Homoserinibacter gongjuensis]
MPHTPRADPEGDDDEQRPRRPRRRVTTPPPAGSDPHPTPEPKRHTPTENDERMRREKPPHY